MKEWLASIFGRAESSAEKKLTGFAHIGDLHIPMEEFIAMGPRKIALLYLTQAQKRGIHPAEQVAFDSQGNMTVKDEEGEVTFTSEK